jgi:putative salt-induced outer membrane protein YdiY
VSVAVPAGVRAQAILNVERLQPENVHGWHSGVEGSIDLARGNTHHTNVGAGVAAGYRWPGDWLRVFAGIAYQDEQGQGLDNDRYLHVRYNHWLGDRLQDFHFVQAQASHSGILQRRYLVGSGLRWRMVAHDATTFDVGSGVMYEHEDLDASRIEDDHPAHERVLRMANLLVLNQRLSSDVRLVGVAYVQPRLTDFGDMRTLLDTSLLFAVTSDVELAVRGQWRHDTRPPGGVEPDDVRFTTGFTVSLY